MIQPRSSSPSYNYEFTLPTERVEAATEYAKSLLGNIVTNNCVGFVKDTLRAAGLEPPLWTFCASFVTAWARVIG
jgi:hypothetical protein